MLQLTFQIGNFPHHALGFIAELIAIYTALLRLFFLINDNSCIMYSNFACLMLQAQIKNIVTKVIGSFSLIVLLEWS